MLTKYPEFITEIKLVFWTVEFQEIPPPPELDALPDPTFDQAVPFADSNVFNEVL